MSKARKCPFTFNLEPPLKRTRGKNVSEEEKIVCKYFKERGATNLSISELTGIGSKSIANILSKDSLKNRKGQGRKRITTEEEDDEIIKRAKKFSRKGSRQLAPDMERKYEIKISSRTFRRRVQEAGGFWGHQKTKYIMTENDYFTRLEYANDHVNRSWKKTFIFHDESFFNLDPNHRQERFFEDMEKGNTKKHWQNLKFECFVTSDWKSKLYFWHEYRKSSTWIECFTKYHEQMCYDHRPLQMGKLTYLFDKAPSHKSKESVKFYHDNGINFEFFCNKPVEINIVERIWLIVKEYTWKKNPKTLPEAKKYLKRAYNMITQKEIREMIDEIPKRLEEVKNCNGDKTHYWSDCSHSKIA